MGNFKAEAAMLPVLYGDTPTLFGQPHVQPDALEGTADVAVSGVPWEGTITWGSWSGCELAPRTIRQASARYGGFLPEYGIDAFDHLRLVDCGDVVIDMQDRAGSFDAIRQRIRQVVRGGALPATYGGDHSITYPIVEALQEELQGPVGIVHFDAHYDNKDEYDGDRYARCCPFRRIAELPSSRPESLVHTGIRGPRNLKFMWEYANAIGARTISIGEIRREGIAKSVREAYSTASVGTRGVYVTICSDVLDAAYNPGGPTDPDGLTAHELYEALHFLGAQKDIVGFDFVEIYPPSDPNGVSSHTAVWALLHLLAGMAERRRDAR